MQDEQDCINFLASIDYRKSVMCKQHMEAMAAPACTNFSHSEQG
jgi:hypothetical protein